MLFKIYYKQGYIFVGNYCQFFRDKSVYQKTEYIKEQFAQWFVDEIIEDPFWELHTDLDHYVTLRVPDAIQDPLLRK